MELTFSLISQFGYILDVHYIIDRLLKDTDSCLKVHLSPPPLCGIEELDGPGDKGPPQPVRRA